MYGELQVSQAQRQAPVAPARILAKFPKKNLGSATSTGIGLARDQKPSYSQVEKDEVDLENDSMDADQEEDDNEDERSVHKPPTVVRKRNAG